MYMQRIKGITNYNFFVGLHGDNTYNTFSCGNTVIKLRGVSTNKKYYKL